MPRKCGHIRASNVGEVLIRQQDLCVKSLVTTFDWQRVVQNIDTQLKKMIPASIDSGASGSRPPEDQVSTACARATE
jgi:hypothetical protein